MKILVNKTKAILAGAMVAFFIGYGIFYLFNGPAVAAAVFLAVGLLFGWLLYRNASTLEVGPDGLRLSFLGLKRREMGWGEVREVGLIGENVFNHGKKKRTGDKYIYFSPIRLNADERFQMIVKWPPREQLYAEYSEKALEYAMTLWHGELMTYNVEDIFPNSEEPRGAKRDSNR